MIVHCFHVHPRDRWCVDFHLGAYLSFCDRVVVVVDGDAAGGEFAGSLRRERVDVLRYAGGGELPESRVNDRGVVFDARALRQMALDHALAYDPSLIVFGDADEVPTPDAADWARWAAGRPQCGERWYVDWVNLWGDFAHAIGGGSAWSHQNPRGNKKCFAMQAGGDMRYADDQHNGMEPGRASGGPAPAGPGRHWVEFPKLVHLKYGWAGYADRPESRLARHAPEAMLRGGEVVSVPAEWLWPGLAVLEGRPQ